MWQLDQLLKPDTSIEELELSKIWTYNYSGGTSDPAPWNNFSKQDTTSTTVQLDIVNVLTNRYEAMAYAAEPWTHRLWALRACTVGKRQKGR